MARAAAKVPPALKHGAYSTATLLPGEDEAAFDRLHESLITELAPQGTLEEHIVANLARFVWRRENLAILRLAALAKNRISDLVHKRLIGTERGDAERSAARTQARKELGQVFELVEAKATESRLTDEIEVRARLDEMIDKCLKRLLFVRGLKSMGRPAAPARIAHMVAGEVATTGEAKMLEAAE